MALVIEQDPCTICHGYAKNTDMKKVSVYDAIGNPIQRHIMCPNCYRLYTGLVDKLIEVRNQKRGEK
jgi:hypothetical protein